MFKVWCPQPNLRWPSQTIDVKNNKKKKPDKTGNLTDFKPKIVLFYIVTDIVLKCGLVVVDVD